MADTTGRFIDVNIVAEDHPLWEGQAVSIVLPTREGYMGILPDHEPVLALLGNGDISITTSSHDKETFPVTGGFVSFQENTLTVGIDRITHLE